MDLYGYLLYPVHAAIFADLVRRAADRGHFLALAGPAGGIP
jgi:hypothetical protein